METEGLTLPSTQASPEAPHLYGSGAFLAPLSYLLTGDPAHPIQPLRLSLKLDLAARPAFPKSSLFTGCARLQGVTYFSEADTGVIPIYRQRS